MISISKKTIGQFSRFVLVGTLNAVIDFVVYLSLTRLTEFGSNHPVVSTVLAFLVASCNGYFLNKYWSFRNFSSRHHVQYSKFMVTMTIGVMLNALLFYWLTANLFIHDVIAKCLVAGIILFWNFFVNKLWTFSSLSQTQQS